MKSFSGGCWCTFAVLYLRGPGCLFSLWLQVFSCFFFFYLVASNSDYNPLLFLGLCARPAVLFHLAWFSVNIKQFIRKLPVLDGDHEHRRMRPPPPTVRQSDAETPRSPWQTLRWTVTSDYQRDLHK